SVDPRGRAGRLLHRWAGPLAARRRPGARRAGRNGRAGSGPGRGGVPAAWAATARGGGRARPARLDGADALGGWPGPTDERVGDLASGRAGAGAGEPDVG